MTSAWVITREGTEEHTTEVLGILSARKTAKVIKEYVEWLYALLYYDPADHLAFARYNKPYNPYKAEYWQTNTGVSVQSKMSCGHNPILVARLAKRVKLISSANGVSNLQWKEPDRNICDPQTRYVTETIQGEMVNIPVHLPMRIISD